MAKMLAHNISVVLIPEEGIADRNNPTSAEINQWSNFSPVITTGFTARFEESDVENITQINNYANKFVPLRDNYEVNIPFFMSREPSYNPHELLFNDRLVEMLDNKEVSNVTIKDFGFNEVWWQPNPPSSTDTTVNTQGVTFTHFNGWQGKDAIANTIPSKFAQHVQPYTYGQDYEVTHSEINRKLSSIAIHGGGIEVGTTELSERLVELTGASWYNFDAKLASNNKALHLTSTLFDDPKCVHIVESSQSCVSWHGANDLTAGVAETWVGGLDIPLRDAVIAELTASGFTAHIAVNTRPEIAGIQPENIANRAARGGVQLELSTQQRKDLFPNGDWSRAVRNSGARTQAFYDYVDAVHRAIISVGIAEDNVAWDNTQSNKSVSVKVVDGKLTSDINYASNPTFKPELPLCDYHSEVLSVSPRKINSINCLSATVKPTSYTPVIRWDTKPGMSAAKYVGFRALVKADEPITVKPRINWKRNSGSSGFRTSTSNVTTEWSWTTPHIVEVDDVSENVQVRLYIANTNTNITLTIPPEGVTIDVAQVKIVTGNSIAEVNRQLNEYYDESVYKVRSIDLWVDSVGQRRFWLSGTGWTYTDHNFGGVFNQIDEQRESLRWSNLSIGYKNSSIINTRDSLKAQAENFFYNNIFRGYVLVRRGYKADEPFAPNQEISMFYVESDLPRLLNDEKVYKLEVPFISKGFALNNYKLIA